MLRHSTKVAKPIFNAGIFLSSVLNSLPTTNCGWEISVKTRGDVVAIRIKDDQSEWIGNGSTLEKALYNCLSNAIKETKESEYEDEYYRREVLRPLYATRRIVSSYATA